MKFHGAITAIVTPFNNGKIDYKAFEEILNWQIESGIHGITILGTTGESPTIDDSERAELIKFALRAVNKRVPVMVGTGNNCTKKTIQYTKEAAELGADGALVVTPYYNKPNQEGLYQHFKAVHDNTDIDICLYNVPGRTNVNLAHETILKLAQLPRIIAIKDATAELERARLIQEANLNNFAQFSGEDDNVIEFAKFGGIGVISVTSNIAPTKVAQVQNLLAQKQTDLAKNIQNELMDLHSVMFIETNPSPVKYALSQMGKIKDELRLPLVNLTEASKQQITQQLKKVGLI